MIAPEDLRVRGAVDLRRLVDPIGTVLKNPYMRNVFTPERPAEVHADERDLGVEAERGDDLAERDSSRKIATNASACGNIWMSSEVSRPTGGP